MGESTMLNWLLWLPALGMAVVTLLPKGRDSLVRSVTFGCMVLQFVIGVILYQRFDGTVAGLQFATDVPSIRDWGVGYRIGLDGLNVLLVFLTVFLGPLVVAGAWSAVQKDVKLFHVMVLFIQFAMLGTFLAQDVFLFYVFWEAMLIPMFLIIGLWGGERRIYATLKFVLYTAFGSILMLAALIYFVLSLADLRGTLSFAFADLYGLPLPVGTQMWLLGAFALSFAIKVPMF